MLEPGVFIGLVFVSLLYLFLCSVVVLRSASVENRLLGLGLLTAVASIVFGSLGGSVAVNVGSGMMPSGGVSAAVGLGSLPMTLMKIGVILVLGAIAKMLWPAAESQHGGGARHD